MIKLILSGLLGVLLLSSCIKEPPCPGRTGRAEMMVMSSNTNQVAFQKGDLVYVYAVERNPDGSAGKLLEVGNYADRKSYYFDGTCFVPLCENEMITVISEPSGLNYYALLPDDSISENSRRVTLPAFHLLIQENL